MAAELVRAPKFPRRTCRGIHALLWEGVYNYSYVTRATTPGQFVVPPAKAEEMYHPETFGRTGTDLVRVE